MQEIAPGVFVETRFRRVNVGAILTDSGFVLIDTPPYPDDAHRWREMLAAISNKPILAIVNTDARPDRVLGNEWLPSRVVVAHEETIKTLSNAPQTFVENAVDELTQHNFERRHFTDARLRVPSVGFTRRMQIRYGGRAIPLLAMPGPTFGSVWVHLPEERVVFVGDSVLANRHPLLVHACSKQWLENLTLLRRARFAADVIVPGRGSLVDKSATEPVSEFLRLARRRVHSLYRAGRPRADTITLVPELLELFPYHPDEAEELQRRIKLSLDRIYEEFKASDKSATF